MKEFKNSKIKDVWKIFEEISRIPRGSGNEAAISEYVEKFANDHGFEVFRDKANNVLVKVKASEGYENFEPIMLQAHLDMVNEKDSDISHDFLNDPLELYVENGYLRARGTTLGADNGIGVAFILAYLTRNNLKHPAIEAIFTSEEETTMAGAKAFDASKLTAKKLLSLDHIAEHEICIGCAGIVKIESNADFETIKVENKSAVEIKLSGLAGGHSGNDIHIRKSAFGFTARLLNELKKKADFWLANLSLGQAANSIARDSKIILIADAKNISVIQKIVAELATVFKQELVNDKIDIVSKEINFTGLALNEAASHKFIDLMMILPNGVQTMTSNPNLPESSLNIGFIKVCEGKVNFGITVRSCVKALETYLVDKLQTIMNTFGFNFNILAVSPFFNTDPNCEIVKLCKEQYKKQYGKELGLKKYHAVMELGVFSSKINDFQGVLMSPELLDIHSPNERLNIESTERTFDLFCSIIENCKF